MKKSRLALHNILVEVLGSRNVYFQAPASTTLKYPCIVYSLSKVKPIKANNKLYDKSYLYRITLIHKSGDNDVVDKLLELPYITFENSFMTQGLYHYVFNLYYKNEKEI